MDDERTLPARDGNGRFPARTSLGGYPMTYLTRGNVVLCAGCASTHDDPDDPLTVGDVRWEGHPEACETCGEEIHTAYGPTPGE